MSPEGIPLYVHQVCLRSHRAFGIVGGNHLGTVGTVEKQQVNYPLLLRSRALHIIGLDLESIATVYPGDGFRRIQRFFTSAHGQTRNTGTAAHPWALFVSRPRGDQSSRSRESRGEVLRVKKRPSGTGWSYARNGLMSRRAEAP